MDFGIARSGNDLGLTVTGTTLGSLDYMSPEQVQAQPTDARSDLYSVGVSLYEMVTGQRMFSATSSFSIMEAQIKETPRPPIEVQPSLPKPLSDMIIMSVAKNPAERFQTADAFRNALSQIRESCGSPGLPKTVVSRQRRLGLRNRCRPRESPMSRQPTPVSQPAASPVYAAATPTPQTDSPLPPKAGSRAAVLILAVAIILLLATLAGARAYRSYKQNAASTVAAGPWLPAAASSRHRPGGQSSARISPPQIDSGGSVAECVWRRPGSDHCADTSNVSTPNARSHNPSPSESSAGSSQCGCAGGASRHGAAEKAAGRNGD